MDDARAVAEAVRAALVAAARDAYEDAGVAGLCAEGRWELALDALRALDLTQALHDATAADESVPRQGPDTPTSE